MQNARLNLGPLLFNWDSGKIRDFYFRIADEAPVDRVHIGEVVCAKRLAGKDYLPEVMDRLTAAGKQVVLSGLALIMDGRDQQITRDLTELADDYLIEANDISTVSLLRGRPHAIGPFINVYNEATLKYYEQGGATHISLPYELPETSLQALSAHAESALEVQVFGRLPLAISARCYHARAHKLSKDGCQYVCDKDPDGLPVTTMEGQNFLAINGLQTLSYSYCNLMAELPALTAMGIRDFRLSPHDVDMVRISRIYRDRLNDRLSSPEANDALEQEMFAIEFSNGYYHGVAGREQINIA
ncbi:ubiquinone anaerobic biosynthesis protein UbiV [Paremcibacter congregatus]|uniref:Ubiquinone biosynthesis protein UbiV n=1 Tax=Paremcibacter congregatus TaxID=2043170 RepID=A0A2G4YQ79_9PROT|nr:U32 family peptidase [Paremcibacter congregatus]PHZ84465.1 U32 family peptidase [Paremcibacter congregatus]QDE28683.1 U32 family peptidase [Paremcibacter congregatus]